MNSQSSRQSYLPQEPNPNERRFSGYDVRDIDFYKKVSHYKEAKSAKLFNRSWPELSDYTMPKVEIARLEAGMDPFDLWSSIQEPRIVEIRRELGYEEDLIDAAREAWIVSEVYMTMEAPCSNEEDESERIYFAEKAETDFVRQFIMENRVIISFDYSETFEKLNAKRRAVKMYINKYLDEV